MPITYQRRFAEFLHRRRLLLVQLVTTLVILAFVPANTLQLLLFLATWMATFRLISVREGLAYLAVCALFSVMDMMAVRQGVFTFSRPDVAGLPIWEFFMWGFYALHILRMLDGPQPSSRLRQVLPLAILFALPFSTVQDQTLLLVASAFALGLALLFFHDGWDLRYMGYTLFVGALVEYVGVWSGQWHYPDGPAGGVAFWFVTMWAGIGIFIRRLIMPLLNNAQGLAPYAAK